VKSKKKGGFMDSDRCLKTMRKIVSTQKLRISNQEKLLDSFEALMNMPVFRSEKAKQIRRHCIVQAHKVVDLFSVTESHDPKTPMKHIVGIASDVCSYPEDFYLENEQLLKDLLAEMIEMANYFNMKHLMLEAIDDEVSTVINFN
jgi:hypothetical protein